MTTRPVALLTILVACGLAVGVGATTVAPRWFQRSPPPTEARGEAEATLVFDSLEHDFGIVQTATELKHSFTVTNNGQAPVTLSVKGLGCACLSLDCPESVGPGSHVQIRVRAEVRIQEGGYTARATLATSDPALPSVELALRFHVEPAVDLDPPSLQFSDVVKGQVLERDFAVRLRIRDEAEVDSSTPTVVSPFAALRCERVRSHLAADPTSGLKRAVHRYRMRLDTKALPASPGGRWSQPLQIRVPLGSSVVTRELSITVSFSHHPGLRGPTSLTVQRKRGEKGVRFRLWSQSNVPFAISKITTSAPGLTARATGKDSARSQEVLVTAQNDQEAAGIQKGFLEVHSPEHPKHPYRIDVLVLP